MLACTESVKRLPFVGSSSSDVHLAANEVAHFSYDARKYPLVKIDRANSNTSHTLIHI
jgi:hypothetical protein